MASKALNMGLSREITEVIEERPNAKLAVHHLRTIREFVMPLRQAFPEAAGFQELDMNHPSHTQGHGG